MPFNMLLIVRYTGQACLSPPNCERLVLSDARMTGATTAPFGNFSCIIDAVRKCGFNCTGDRTSTHLSLPPPLSRPHLVVSPHITLLINKHLLAVVCQVITKCRISHELSDALHRITNPQLVFLREKLAVFVP